MKAIKTVWESMNRFGKALPRLILSWQFVSSAMGLFALISLTLYANTQSEIGATTVLIQALCFVFAFLWTAFLARGAIASLFSQDIREWHIHPAWLLVLAAIVCRFMFGFLMPPAHQTGFEELQTGEDAFNILRTGAIPIEFRFTNILASLGLQYGAAIDIDSLRVPFRIAGLISLVILVLALRGMKLRWIPTLMIAFTAATMRFLVLASGVADELFASMIYAIAMLMCLIQSENSDHRKPFWAAASGIIAGMLMYEYTSYRVYFLLGLLWFLWRCFFQGKSMEVHPPSSRWFTLGAYLLPVYLIALPTILQTVHHPESSVFFEAFYRHGIDRPSLFSPNFFSETQNLILGMTGWPAAVSAFYVPSGEPVILPVIGSLFALGFLYCLFLTRRGFARALALTTILTVISAGLFANNTNIGRMAPVIPMLLIMTGLLLDNVIQKLANSNPFGDHPKLLTFSISNLASAKPNVLEGKPDSANVSSQATGLVAGSKQIVLDFQKLYQRAIAAIIGVASVALTIGIVIAQYQTLAHMVADPTVMNEFTNDDYSVCAYIGSVAAPSQHVYIYSSEHTPQCSSDTNWGWYFAGNPLRVEHVSDNFLLRANLQPGDLVVVGSRNRALREDEISQLIALGNRTNSLSSLEFSKNISGRITSASICNQCANAGK
jgi:hypothetical protein